MEQIDQQHDDAENDRAASLEVTEVKRDQSSHDGVWLIAAGTALGFEILLPARSTDRIAPTTAVNLRS